MILIKNVLSVGSNPTPYIKVKSLSEWKEIMTLIRRIDGSYKELSDVQYEAIKSEYVTRVRFRKDFHRVRGIVKIEGPNDVGLYSEDGWLVMPLTCSAEDVEKFRALAGQCIESIPVKRWENGQNSPLIK